MTLDFETKCYKCGEDLQIAPVLIEAIWDDEDYIEKYNKEHQLLKVNHLDGHQYTWKHHECNLIKKLFYKKRYSSQSEVPVKRTVIGYTSIIRKKNE